MKFNAVAAAFSLGLTIAAGPGADATASDSRSPRKTQLAQVRPEAGDATADNLRGIGLTASHKQIIFDHIGTEQAQPVPNNAELSIGSTIPDSLVLNTMPIGAKDRIGQLKDLQFVKVADSKMLLVDPATRKSWIPLLRKTRSNAGLVAVRATRGSHSRPAVCDVRFTPKSGLVRRN